MTNPLDHMTTLAAQVSGLPKEKVMGQAGILDSSRMAHFISEATGVDIQKVSALTLGSHGATMVPVPSQSTVDGKPLVDVLDEDAINDIVERTRNGGAEIVEYLKTGSAYYAPSSAAAQMVKAILNDEEVVVPTCAWTTGQYGISDVYLGVPARLGSAGVEEIIEYALTDAEQAALDDAAEAVLAKVGELQELALD